MYIFIEKDFINFIILGKRKNRKRAIILRKQVKNKNNNKKKLVLEFFICITLKSFI